MTRLLLTFAASAVLAVQVSADVTTPKPPDLETQLTRVFADWTKAMHEADTELWQKSTAQYRKNGMRNIVVSQKKPWPDSLFDTLVAPPDISGLKLAKVAEKGLTAQLIYYGKVDFQIESDEVPDGLLFLMFVKETDGWKFNTLRYMSLATAEEVADDASVGLFDFLDAPEFQPPGRVPPVPKLCPAPEIVGYVEIVSIGYETTMRIADRSEHTVIDNVQQGLIIGGLKAGINPVTVHVKPLPLARGVAEKDAGRHLEYTVYRQTDDPDKPLHAIYESGPIKAPKSHRLIVRGGG
jgi:hypothetical protein